MSCLGYSSNYAASQYSQETENKKDINQDMKRTIEVTKLNVITLSENKKKGHANCNSKSSNTVQSGNPIIKRKNKDKTVKEDHLDTCDWVSFCAYAFNRRYNICL